MPSEVKLIIRDGEDRRIFTLDLKLMGFRNIERLTEKGLK